MVTLFNFQGSVASELSFVSFSILSHRSRFVKYFFQDFLIFIFDLLRDFFATAYLFYHIEFCLSSTFFDFFQNLFSPASLPSSHKSALNSRLSGGFSVSLTPVSLRQLHYLTTPISLCQLLFSLFFDLFSALLIRHNFL